jgi:hypothetical protein
MVFKRENKHTLNINGANTYVFTGVFKWKIEILSKAFGEMLLKGKLSILVGLS